MFHSWSFISFVLITWGDSVMSMWLLPYREKCMLKGYFRWKIIFYYFLALTVSWIYFLIWREKVMFRFCLSFLFIDFFVNLQTPESLRPSHYYCNSEVTFLIVYYNPMWGWMKFGQIIVRPTTNICNLILSLLRRLDTSSRPFYDFNRIVV